MDYIEDQLQRTQPELLVQYHEALKVLETGFEMRFSFSALLLREITKLATNSRAPEDISDVEREYPWLPADAFYLTEEGDKRLSQRGHFLIFAYGSENPEIRFSAAQRQAVDAAFAELKSIKQPLNKAVHEIVYSSQLTDKEGRELIDKVRESLDQVLRLKRTILGIVEIRVVERATMSIAIDSIVYEKRP